MGTEPIVESQTGSYRYEAIVRISETIAACREPEEMATTLASEIGKFLHFDHLYFVVLKENSTEIEYLLWGKSLIPVLASAGPAQGLGSCPTEGIRFPWSSPSTQRSKGGRSAETCQSQTREL